MSRKKSPNKKIAYRNYSFRCTIGVHDTLIRILDSQPDNERSDYIRDQLELAANIIREVQPKPIDLQTLRSELEAAVNDILDNLPQMAISQTPAANNIEPTKRQDVNKMGDRIPDF